MFEFDCEKCGRPMYYDADMTFAACMGGLDYLENNIEFIQNKWLAQKLVYTCVACQENFAYTFKEIEEKVRTRIAADVMFVRRTNMVRKLDPRTINPDNGLDYCGVCSGVDGDGNCYVDVIKQCSIKDTK